MSTEGGEKSIDITELPPDEKVIWEDVPDPATKEMDIQWDWRFFQMK